MADQPASRADSPAAKPRVVVYYRRARTFDETDPKERTLRADPYWVSLADPAQIVGRIGHDTVGSEYVFPLRYRLAGCETTVLAGSTLNVEKRFRKTRFGLDLPELRWQHSPSKVAVGAGLSQMALPVHQLLDYHAFELPRYIALWKSRAVVETKVGGGLGRLLAHFADCALALFAWRLRRRVRRGLKGVSFRTVRASDAEGLRQAARLLAENARPCQEIHDFAWLRWQLRSGFSRQGEARLTLAFRGDRPVGLYLVRRRFYETASHRGFKNLWLTSVLDWQVVAGEEPIERFLLARAALEARADSDAAEVTTDDAALGAAFHGFGWRRVGAGNFVIKAGEGADPAIAAALGDRANWRLRPAMGDNGF